MNHDSGMPPPVARAHHKKDVKLDPAPVTNMRKLMRKFTT